LARGDDPALAHRASFQDDLVTFADNLRQLPAVDHLAALHLLDAGGQVVAAIKNKPGKAGSLAVYAALAARHGGRIDVAAAQEGLGLFAEHTAAARAHPGSHPNIDRLFEVIESGQGLTVKLVDAA
jgi:hypothetical protein